MPIITLEAGKMKQEQKEDLISGFTKVASDVLGIAEEHFIVLLKENGMDNIGSGGKTLSKLMALR